MKRLVLATLALPMLAAAAGPKSPPARTEVTWLGHAAFLVKTPQGAVLAVDPWLSNPANPDKESLQKIDRVDYILVSHGHFDHVGEAIALAKKTGAKLVATFDLMQALVSAGYPKEQATMATAGNVGGTIALTPDLSVTFVPAVHSSTFKKDDASPVEPAGSPTGLVIQVRGGPTLYHTGDTAATSDMRLIGYEYKVDVMLACIGGHFTMDPSGAAIAASLVRPKVIVPMHYGTFPLLTGTPAELDAELKRRSPKTKMIAMKPGETRSF
ncbi:MAG TPA: metal-dependent hydrolase [Anaeromyxobacteraceae bacterium]|nr:metal-dependent hydrolase [Anaeromyxobacteraceae bacterium]